MKFTNVIKISKRNKQLETNYIMSEIHCLSAAELSW